MEISMTFKDRVIKEENELSQKLSKLTDFMQSDSYCNLSAVNQGLLMVQHLTMKNYLDVLGRRLELI